MADRRGEVDNNLRTATNLLSATSDTPRLDAELLMAHALGIDRRQGGEIALLLLFARGFENRRGGQGMRDQGRGQQAAPAFLQHHHQVNPAEPGAAVGLGEGQAQPSQPPHFAPEIPGKTELRLHDPPYLGHGRALGEEALDFAAQTFLLRRKTKVHRDVPRPARAALNESLGGTKAS